LIRGTASSQWEVRSGAVGALGNIRADAGSCLPVLIKCLKDTNDVVRFNTVNALRQFRADAKPALPALVETFKSGTGVVSKFAGEAAMQIDPEAARSAGVKLQ